jgi:radical SAM protein with 4Fe4S-binding SPASM domain
MTDSQGSFYPKHLLIETTTRCNLRCKQCARLVDKYALADMDMATFERLTPLFPHLREVALYGHGETFLHKRFFDMLAAIKQYPIFVYVTTNGTLLTDSVAARLVELRLDRLAISIDAATPELFNAIRRGADYQQVLGNIRRLNACKRRAHRDHQPDLSIMFCAMHSTIQELPALVRLADELNMLHGIAVLNIVEHGTEAAGENVRDAPDLMRRYLNEANRLAAQFAIPLEISGAFAADVDTVVLSLWERFYRNYREFRRSFDRFGLLRLKLARLWRRWFQPSPSANQHPIPSGPADPQRPTIQVRDCRDPWEFVFVNVHGDVRICCVSHRIMGNVHKTDLLSIWNSPEYQTFRSSLLSIEPPTECRTCPARGWRAHPQAD